MRALMLIPPFLLASAVACEPNTTTEPVPAEVPSFDIANAPPLSGIVVRYGWPLGALLRDPQTGLGLAIGIGAQEFCSGTPGYYLQTWADNELADRIVSIGQSPDAPAEVWAAASPSEWTCAAILAGEPLASGVSKTVATFTDYLNTGSGNPIVAWTGHGILTTADGARAVFHWRFKMNEQQGGLTDLMVTLR